MQLPHSEAAELAVLGSCIRWGSQALADVRSIMGDTSLHLGPSKEIWLALRSLDEQGRPLDRTSLEAELRSRGKLELIGGTNVIELVASKAAEKSSHVLAHATLVAETAQARAVVEVAQGLAMTLLTNPLTGDALAEELTSAADQITTIARSGAGGKHPWSAKHVGDESERERQLEISGKTRAISTGFPRLDWMCKRKGPRPGWLVVLSGRPKMGKTSAALQMAIEALFERASTWPTKWRLKRNPTPVLIACDEMKASELYDRMLANLAGLDASALSAPTYKWHEHYKDAIAEARALLDKSPLVFVPDYHSGDLTKIFSYVRRWRSTHPIQGRDQDGNPIRDPALCVLDFLQSFKDMPGTEKKSEPARIGARAKFIKEESKALGLISLLLSQLNREPEKRDRDDRRPRASDNEGSGKIEWYADVLIGCYRDIVYDDRKIEYEDQVKELRLRAASAVKSADRDISKAMRELDEMISIRSIESQQRRFDALLGRCFLGPTEFDELAKASGRLSAAEFIVQLNRHGSTGTVYVDFHGQHYRFTTRQRTS